MKTTDWKDKNSTRAAPTKKLGPGAFYLSAPFLLSVGIVGILPWVAG